MTSLIALIDGNQLSRTSAASEFTSETRRNETAPKARVHSSMIEKAAMALPFTDAFVSQDIAVSFPKRRNQTLVQRSCPKRPRPRAPAVISKFCSTIQKARTIKKRSEFATPSPNPSPKALKNHAKSARLISNLHRRMQDPAKRDGRASKLRST